MDPEGKRIESGQDFIDLAVNTMMFVKEPIDETKVKTDDKKLMVELKAQRWWIK
jgi:hypothetical protein